MQWVLQSKHSKGGNNTCIAPALAWNAHQHYILFLNKHQNKHQGGKTKYYKQLISFFTLATVSLQNLTSSDNC